MAGYVNVRAYAELNDFLGPEPRGVQPRRPFQPHQTVKDVLEAMGIPHTEVDLILVTGMRKVLRTGRLPATASPRTRCSRRSTSGPRPDCGRCRCVIRASSSTS